MSEKIVSWYVGEAYVAAVKAALQASKDQWLRTRNRAMLNRKFKRKRKSA